MEIHSEMTTSIYESLSVSYRESDPMQDLQKITLSSVHAYCFYKNKLVVVYAPSKKYWTPPGGGIEVCETYQEAVVREVHEESNMKVLH